jgi:hypothetical protein
MIYAMRSIGVSNSRLETARGRPLATESTAKSRATSKSPKAAVRAGVASCAQVQRLAMFWTSDAGRYKRTQASRSEMNA